MEWRDVVGYEGFYQVSENGDIRSLSRNFKLRRTGLQDGHVRIMLLQNGERKNYRVHTLVYRAFVGEIPEGHDIHHIDEDKSHNNFRNLGTLKMEEHRSLHSKGENNPRAKLTQQQVDDIRKRYPRESIREIADSVGQSYRNIHRIVRRIRWK